MLLPILLCALPLREACATSVVTIGDSWSFLIAPRLQEVFTDAGVLDPGVATLARRADSAANLSSPGGLAYLTQFLAAHPDATAIHLSIGAIDVFSEVAAGNPLDDAFYLGVADDVGTIVGHVLSILPGVEVFQSSYDYFPLSADPAANNAYFEGMYPFIQALADTDVDHSFENFSGLMQLNYGFPGLGIPPFDPRLPDNQLPSPEPTGRTSFI